MTRRLAFAILRRYPPAWRERYEAEVSALIEQSGVRFGDLAELVRGLLTERAAALLLDDERPRRAMWFLGLLKPLFTIALILTASIVGYALRWVTGPWSEALQIAGMIGFGIFMIAFGFVIFRARRPFASVGPPYSARVGGIMLSAFFVAVVFVQWGQLFGTPDLPPGRFDWPAANRWFMWVGYLTLIADLASALWPAQQMLNAFTALHNAEAHIKTNRQWVEDCRTWIAKGVPSPLAEAESQVEQGTRARDAAREQLHALGYRARFGL